MSNSLSLRHFRHYLFIQWRDNEIFCCFFTSGLLECVGITALEGLRGDDCMRERGTESEPQIHVLLNTTQCIWDNGIANILMRDGTV